ncbi:hypothetical protein HY385_02950 [Candidatus Daviesbacteria bacterium]|nr:hypothetical protein [Candidatus Daviesbacteria bacterium]
MGTKWISRFYVLFVGIIIAVTVGFGLAAFYPKPVAPFSPAVSPALLPESCKQTPEAMASVECQQILTKQTQEQEKQSQQYNAAMETFRNKNAAYTRTTVFFGITIGAFLVLMGLFFIKKSKLLAHGLLLAGIFTAIFANLLVSLASLGAPVAGTTQVNMIAYAQFGILLVLSIAVCLVGLVTLKEE